MNPAVSVVIPTCRQAYLRNTLEGLARQASGTTFEVVVVENGPRTPETGRLANEFGCILPVHYLFSSTAGLNRARNLGTRLARAPIVALLDDDTVPEETWLAAVVNAHREFPEAGIIGGRTGLRFRAQPPAWLVGQFRDALAEVNWSAFPRFLKPNEWIVGANMSFDMRTFETAGGFAENLGMCGRGAPQLTNDESEFCDRAMQKSCAKILYDPRMGVTHQIAPERLDPDYFVQRFYGHGYSRAFVFTLTEPETKQASAVIGRLRRHIHDGSWGDLIVGHAGSLPDEEQDFYLALSACCRVAYFEGMLEMLRSKTNTGLDTSIRNERYYRYGRRTMSRHIRRNGSSRPGRDLWATLRSLAAEPRRVSRRPETVLGRISYLRGMRDACAELTDATAGFPRASAVVSDSSPRILL